MIYVPVAICILYIVAEKIFIEMSNLKYPRLVVRLGWLAALAILVFSRGYVSTIEALKNYVNATNVFTYQIEQVSSLLEKNPEFALVLESGNIWDYEPIFSYERFLRAYGVKNPIFLRIHGYSPETVSAGLQRKLAIDLLDISNRGNNLFQPLTKLEYYQNRCFSLQLSGSFKNECQSIP
jgi:hypothetical protein